MLEIEETMIWLLLIIYQIKHFIADYPLQGKYMLGKFKPYPDFILPLLAHSEVHGSFTFLIAFCVKGYEAALALAILDMTIHFAVDRVKASPDLLGRFSALSKKEAIRLMTDGIAPKSVGISTPQEVAEAWKSNTYFWWALGADQFAHHLTHYFIIWALVS